jgi:hypothetical protein
MSAIYLPHDIFVQYQYHLEIVNRVKKEQVSAKVVGGNLGDRSGETRA